jgi:hypothetical protein
MAIAALLSTCRLKHLRRSCAAGKEPFLYQNATIP